MIHRPLRSAFLTAILLHFMGLTMVSLVWRSSGFPTQPQPTALEMVMVMPVLQPDTSPEPALTPPSPVPSEPETPPEPEPITPPKIVEKPMLKPPEPSAKRPPSAKSARPKKPLASQSGERPPGLSSAAMDKRQEPKRGPSIPLPDEAPEVAGGNVLGPPTKVEEPPQHPSEGGEAGAGHLFERGQVAVTPGSGAEGGSGGPGHAGLGLGAESQGTRGGGLRPGSGGDGPGGGKGGVTGPSGGYQVKPRYPESARRQGVEGTVLLKVRVTEQGRVEAVQLERSTGHPDLDQAAIEAVRRWRFEPAHRGSQAMAVWALIPVAFKLE
jgi:periplasmic protein TonB